MDVETCIESILYCACEPICFNFVLDLNFVLNFLKIDSNYILCSALTLIDHVMKNDGGLLNVALILPL